MHFYFDRVFRDKAIIKVKDGSRTFVLLGVRLSFFGNSLK